MGYGFASYWRKALVGCQHINILNEVQASVKSLRIPPPNFNRVKMSLFVF